MKRIDTLDQLKQERVRLKLQLAELEDQIQDDVRAIKEELKPAHLVATAFGNLLTYKDHGILNEGLNIGIDLLLRRIIFKNSGLIAKFVVPFFAKNFTSNWVADHKADILEWIVKKLQKFKKRDNHQEVYDRTTADTNI